VIAGKIAQAAPGVQGLSTTIILDTSASMATAVTNGQRRIDMLAAVLSAVMTPNARLIAFNDAVVVLEPGQELPEPSGSTALHLALEYVGLKPPQQAIIISDGQPDDAKAALAAARALGCVISTFYCGEETNRAAIAFMKQLALCSRGGVGRPQVADLRKLEKLIGELRLLLAGPAG
jgi:hypothetical protein